MEHDYVVVGSGLFGAVFAQQAREAGKSVLVIERRDHVGGNCWSYDCPETGINVHAYGTHIFHCSSDEIWQYVNRFTGLNRYRHRVLTTHRDRVYSMPINLGTVNAFYGVSLRPFEVESFLESKRENITMPRNLEEKAISLIGRDLYEAFVKGYTAKQWGCDPCELPASIINRLPVRVSYEDSYFDDRYQGIPLEGYGRMFERMLEGIPVELGVDFFDDREHWMRHAKKVVYTGPLDRFFDYEHGRLSWRSVRFERTRVDIDDYQGTSVMNYADGDVPYTRIHEPKHLHPERRSRTKGKTVVIREYSHVDDDQPYYPVNFPSDQDKLARYQAQQSEHPNVIFGGRLAQYRYLDMHQVIGAALRAAARELSS
ncbi:UDP-galactopyranose mutase [Sandaracinus amylolyticus]|uniref:UDP-galactopyranose mutase n=1 Tax=Sandaracinus amylolyticus TaxID=927083 RepID=A0A0F6W7J0_9BACT|nr:UDP-galactopyranose mutase [Sandaracinus amylolyticus]AKF09423.1 UDP-galactopyranose mutase [Sandaracinus amylolyticus]